MQNLTLGRLIPASFLLLTSCQGSKWDGVYQIVFEFVSASCNPGDSPYQPGYSRSRNYQITVSHTAADTMVVDFLNNTLAGRREGQDFTVSTAYSKSDSSCVQYEYSQEIVFKGAFTDDLGIEGTVTARDSELRVGCSASDRNEACEELWKVNGILLENAEERHQDRVHWGYTPPTTAGGSY